MRRKSEDRSRKSEAESRKSKVEKSRVRRPATHYSLLTTHCLLLAACVAASFGQRLPDSLRSYGKAEQEQVKKALALQGITEPELGFDKKWATDSFFRLRVVDDLLDHPLHGPDYCDSSAMIVRDAGGNIPALLLFEDQATDAAVSAADTVLLNREIDEASAQGHGWEAAPTGLSQNLVQSLRLIFGSYEVAGKYLKQALRDLKRDELDRLLLNAPTLWGDEDDTTEHYLKGALHREFGLAIDTGPKFDTDTVLPIFRRIDRRALALSGLAVALAANRTRMLLAATPPAYPLEMPPVKADGVQGECLYYAETKWGRVVVGGRGRNVYDGDFCLVIDLGGDDVYTGRVGAGIGGLGRSGDTIPNRSDSGHVPSPFGVCIDLAGNDLYDAPKTLFNFGTGLFGVGILVDEQGDDVYRGYHNTEGVGMYGTGVLLDAAGNDVYDGGWNCQACGIVGNGLLVDLAGNDGYRIQDYGQGFASVWGYGLLADHAGNDIYYAGGKYIHHPLLPHEYRSFAQGFAIGFRPDCSGGIGFLFDNSGNDFYNAEVFAQATSYWYSLGMIYDGAGDDHYIAEQYSQGAGIHLSVGILIDRDGDDQYYSRLGPTQGEGHDLSVGVLIDCKGNDSYCNAGGGQGMGLTNSFGMLIDEQGQDNYLAADGQGTGSWARGFGGMGVFIDEDGDNDRYVRSSRGDNNTIWTQGTYGTGISLPAKPKPETPAEETTYTPDTSHVKRPIKDVFKDASVWQVGEARNRTRRARKELITRGGEAARYMAEEELNTKDGLALEAITEFAKSLPDSIAPFLFKGLHEANRYTRSNCAYLIGQAKIKNGVDTLLAALKLPGFRPRWAIGAFGEIGDRKVVPMLIPYLSNPVELTRLTTCATLGKLKDPRALPGLVKTLDDPLFTVRSAAEQAIVDIGDTSAGFLLLSAQSGMSVRQSLHLARALGTIGAKLDTASRREWLIGIRDRLSSELLHHPDPAVRGVAVEALGKLPAPGVHDILEQGMNDEADRYVLGKYRDALKPVSSE
jgi:HEAT repeat protein